jgi:hypothetical protein
MLFKGNQMSEDYNTVIDRLREIERSLEELREKIEKQDEMLRDEELKVRGLK